MDIGEPGRGGPRQRPWVVHLFFYSLKCFFRRVNISLAKMEMSPASDPAARARCYNKRCNNPHFNKFRYDMDGNSVPPLCIQSLQAYTHTHKQHTHTRAHTHTHKRHTHAYTCGHISYGGYQQRQAQSNNGIGILKKLYIRWKRSI